MVANRLIVTQGHQHELLMKHFLLASQLHWVAGQPPAQQFECKAKVRYRQTEETCQVKILDRQPLPSLFPDAQRAITPGQSIVFYQQDTCLGGGIIDAMAKDCPEW